jgi:hypothetical protein
MMKPRLRVLLLSLACAAGLLSAPGVAGKSAAAETSPAAIVSLNVHTDRNVKWKDQRPQTWAAHFTTPPTLAGGIDLQWGDGLYGLRIGATPTYPLRRGTFTAVSTGVAGTRQHDLDASLESYAFEGGGGTIEVLDVAADSAGVLTRFDILFQLSHATPWNSGFGQIRMNQPELGSAAQVPTARHLHWPVVGVGNPAVLAEDSFRNTSQKPVAYGRAAVRGGSARDFAISSDTCSERTLAPDSTCSITLAFKPRAGGPRVSTLVVPVQGQLINVGLSGAAPLGRSSLTTSGADYINAGRRHTYSPLIAFGSGKLTEKSPAHLYRWVADPEGRQARNDPFLGMTLDLSRKYGAFKLGTHKTHGRSLDYGLTYGARYNECIELKGTEKVKAFQVDADGQPTYAIVDFTQTCFARFWPTATLTGRLRYQVRADTTPPARPTRLQLRGKTVTWKNSSSRDLQTTVVRIETGSKVTATTGYGLSAGSATQATLPVLRRGRTYRIAAFSIDKVGNTSKPTTRTFVY